MSKKLIKEVYTLQEVGEILFTLYPGRWVHETSAYASAKGMAQILGVEDINGKKRNKLISRRDAQRIMDALSKNQRGAGKNKAVRAGKASTTEDGVQVNLFEDGILDWIDPYTPNSAPIEEAGAEDPKPDEQMEVDPQELFEAGVELMRAISRFAEVIGMNRRN